MNKQDKKLSRRSVIAGAAVGAAGLGAATVSALNKSWFTDDARGEGSWWGRDHVALAQAGYEEWSRHVGSDFTLRTEAGAAGFKLAKVEPIASPGHRPQGTRSRGFMAVFEAPGGAKMAGDRIYPVEHPTGALDIYFSAASPNLPVARLKAIFN